MKRIVILSLLLAQLSLRAQEVKQFSLQEALAFTEQNNLSYLNAQYDVQIAKETVKQTTSYGLPHGTTMHYDGSRNGRAKNVHL
ncbi:MAG: hypothetical protein EBQ97_07065 [Bacteroidetes bacterium]|nr:hypothetical protein [Bacteroidota bacterium]